MDNPIICPWCSKFISKLDELKKVISNINNETYSLYYCRNCELQFFYPLKLRINIYSDEEIKDYEEFHKGRSKIPEWTKEFLNIIKKMKSNLSEKKILEIGSGDCINFLALNKFGVKNKNYYAIENDKKSVEVCKNRGVKHIIRKFFNEKIKIRKKFDIILALEVLEHQTQPKKFIEMCFKLLKNNGILVVSVPNRERVFLKSREMGDIPPHHFLRFNKQFFRKNFKNKLIVCKSFSFKNKKIKDTSRRISITLLNTDLFWPLFFPLVTIVRLLDKIKGEGIITLIKK